MYLWKIQNVIYCHFQNPILGKNELNEKFKLENDVTESLRNELARKEQNNDKLEKTIKEVTIRNHN